MNKPIRLLIVAIITVFILSLLITNDYISKKINDYAITITERTFGHTRLQPKQEKFITALAVEIGITKPFFIRKTNPAGLQYTGYANAFVFFSSSVIPLSNQAFLYISEGFFEDLSPQEQRFVIGHELIHMKEGHGSHFLPTFILSCILLCILGWLWLRKPLHKLIKTYVPPVYHMASILISSGLALGLCFISVKLVAYKYLRGVEWEADKVSVAILNSHEGGIKFIERIQKEFGQPSHEPYWGLLCNHPSLYDRKAYLLSLRNTTTIQDRV